MSVNNVFRLSPLVRENISVAVKSIIHNRLRSVLTIIIIAIGITSLVGILTAIEALKHEVYDTYKQIGTSYFYIRSNYYSMRGGTDRSRMINPREISYYQAKSFKENYKMPAAVTVYSVISDYSTVQYESNSTNPTSYLVAADENYLTCKNLKIVSGRGFSENELNSGISVAILGHDVARTLFRNESPIEKVITISGRRFVVIGVLEKTSIRDPNYSVIIPIPSARASFIGESSSFEVGIAPMVESMDYEKFYTEAEFLFRAIRRLSPSDKNDFMIRKSESQIEELRKIWSSITIVSVTVGLITLIGAAVGLMNIMLVSVKERTREIGTRKALGASSKVIKYQFLVESVIISETGCVAGILAGLSIGNIISAAMGVSSFIPWMWLCFAVILCLAVGISSGYIPAVRAARLDPIEALRYE